MKEIFCLTCSNYDGAVNYYMLAPENTNEESFNKLCNSLLEEAAEISCKQKGHIWEGIAGNYEKCSDTWVGWSNLIHNLAYFILPKHGYEMVKLPSAYYCGSHIIRNKEDDADNLLTEKTLNTIITYNNQIKKHK